MKTYRHFLLILLAMCGVQPAFSEEIAEKSAVDIQPVLPEQQFEDGRDYFSYRIPIKSDYTGKNQLLIQWFFDYDCRSCADVQDILALYEQLHATTIVFKQYPLALPDAQFSARTFFTLNALGRRDVSDALLFETAEKKQYQKLAKLDNLVAWLEKNGVDGRTFREMFHSPEITRATQEMMAMTEKYGVFTYPFVVIGGKYVLTGSTLYDDDYALAVLDFLVKKLRDEK